MNQVSVRWQNIIDHRDSGIIVGELPLSIGHGETNDIVLPASLAGVCYQHVCLTSIPNGIAVVDVCSNFLDEPHNQDFDYVIAYQDPFYLGLYRLTVDAMP